MAFGPITSWQICIQVHGAEDDLRQNYGKGSRQGKKSQKWFQQLDDGQGGYTPSDGDADRGPRGGLRQVLPDPGCKGPGQPLVLRYARFLTGKGQSSSENVRKRTVPFRFFLYNKCLSIND